MEKGLDDPMFDQKTSCFKKHLKTILFATLLIVIIIVIVIIVLVVKNKDKDGNKDNNKRTYDYALNLAELKERTDPDNLFTFIL